MSLPIASRLRAVIFPLFLLLTAGCQTFDFPGVYKIEVPQGNVYDQEMIHKLEVGMTRSQVRFVMGTPLITDTFNQDRWDYTYQVQKGVELSGKKRLSLYFDNDLLSRISDETANAEDAAAATTEAAAPAQRPVKNEDAASAAQSVER